MADAVQGLSTVIMLLVLLACSNLDSSVHCLHSGRWEGGGGRVQRPLQADSPEPSGQIVAPAPPRLPPAFPTCKMIILCSVHTNIVHALMSPHAQ